MIREAIATPQVVSRRPNVPQRVARAAMMKRIDNLKRGRIVLDDGTGRLPLGQPSDLTATIRVHDPRFYLRAALGGTLSVAQSYLDGDWDCDDLTSLFRIFVRDIETADGLDGGTARLLGIAHRVYHALRRNSREGSRRNIAAHYDLGNDFFRLWLDETLAYSCGVFTADDPTLEEASREKFDRVCRKLDLQSGDEVLEIGAGWGGFALHAAAHYGCLVTTTTISRHQYEVAQARIAAAGLTDRVTVLTADYRALHGQFDKLVSIEMIEAVGHRYLDTYFGKCSELLKPDGTALLQAIVMPERRHQQYLRSVDFIQRYVFPGGCLPSLGSMLASASRTGDLRLVHAEDFAPHYAQTIRCWRERFSAQLDAVRRLGYAEEFVRLWTYYLCYCEALFEERYVGLLQVQFDKPLARRDPATISTAAANRRPNATPPHRSLWSLLDQATAIEVHR